MVQFKEVAYQIKETCFPVVLKDEFKTCYIELKKRRCAAFLCSADVLKWYALLKRKGGRALTAPALPWGVAQLKDLAHQIQETCLLV